MDRGPPASWSPVRSTELFELDELTTIIEQMTPVDATGYNTFIGTPSSLIFASLQITDLRRI